MRGISSKWSVPDPVDVELPPVGAVAEVGTYGAVAAASWEMNSAELGATVGVLDSGVSSWRN